MHYVESYMAHVNDGLYHIFPSARFVLWLKSCPSKSTEDKMLLYAMMALGAVFSARPDRLMALRRYSRVARFAAMKSQYALSLQLAQSHLILGILYYATGSLVGSWDSIGAAARVVSGLRYNVEAGGVIVDQSQISSYGLHVQALIECRRRTFWVAFILEVSMHNHRMTLKEGTVLTDKILARLELLLGILHFPLIRSGTHSTPLSRRDIRNTAVCNCTLLPILTQPVISIRRRPIRSQPHGIPDSNHVNME